MSFSVCCVSIYVCVFLPLFNVLDQRALCGNDGITKRKIFSSFFLIFFSSAEVCLKTVKTVKCRFSVLWFLISCKSVFEMFKFDSPRRRLIWLFNIEKLID